jgi:hypothetical protein
MRPVSSGLGDLTWARTKDHVASWFRTCGLPQGARFSFPPPDARLVLGPFYQSG